MFLRHTKEIKHYESSAEETKLFFMLPDDGFEQLYVLYG